MCPAVGCPLDRMVRALATDSLIAEFTAFATCEAIVALPQQPVHYPEYERRTCQRSNGARARGLGIKNDELATQRNK